MITILVITGYALFWAGLIYLIILGRVENAWVYSAIVFFLAWFGSAAAIGLMQAAGEQDRINEMMEKKWMEEKWDPKQKK